MRLMAQIYYDHKDEMENIERWKLKRKQYHDEREKCEETRAKLFDSIGYPEKKQLLINQFLQISVHVDKYILINSYVSAKSRLGNAKLTFLRHNMNRIFPVRMTMNDMFVFKCCSKWWFWSRCMEDAKEITLNNYKNDINDIYHIEMFRSVRLIWKEICIRRMQRRIRKKFGKQMVKVHQKMNMELLNQYLAQKQKVRMLLKESLRDMSYPAKDEVFNQQILLTSIPVETEIVQMFVNERLEKYVDDADELKRIISNSFPVRLRIVYMSTDFYLHYQGTWWSWDSSKPHSPIELDDHDLEIYDPKEVNILEGQCWKKICINRLQRAVRGWLSKRPSVRFS